MYQKINVSYSRYLNCKKQGKITKIWTFSAWNRYYKINICHGLERQDLHIWIKKNQNFAKQVWLWREYKKYEELPVIIFKQPIGKIASSWKMIQLLLLKEDSNHIYNYLPIVNHNHLLNTQSIGVRERIWCEMCLQPFYNKNAFEKHCEWWYRNKKQIEILPPEGTTYKLHKWRKTILPSYWIVVDTECLTTKTLASKSVESKSIYWLLLDSIL